MWPFGLLLWITGKWRRRLGAGSFGGETFLPELCRAAAEKEFFNYAHDYEYEYEYEHEHEHEWGFSR